MLVTTDLRKLKFFEFIGLPLSYICWEKLWELNKVTTYAYNLGAGEILDIMIIVGGCLGLLLAMLLSRTDDLSCD
jgi:hypothetical protein